MSINLRTLLSNTVTAIKNKLNIDSFTWGEFDSKLEEAVNGADAFSKAFFEEGSIDANELNIKTGRLIIPNGIKKICASCLKYCTFTNVTFPDSVETIEASAFEYGELTHVTLGNGVKSIGESSFRYCKNLKTVNLNDKLTSVGERAFQGTKITDVTFPKGVTTIPNTLFLENQLTSMRFPNHEAVPTFSDTSSVSWFSDSTAVYVPAKLLSAWKAADIWNKHSNNIYAIS